MNPLMEKDGYGRGNSMSDKRNKTPSSRKILWVILLALLGTAIMGYLNAYEKLRWFLNAHPIFCFRELIVFFPAFIAMGFVLYSAGQIKVLESEITKRKNTEEALLESEKKFRELSITDELTGLFNVRYFYNELKDEIDRADRYLSPLSLIFVDIDDFKKYNDRYGHLEGDIVLKKIAQTIQFCMRDTDSAYRYGGDEFVGILPETHERGAIILSERIINSIGNLKFTPDSENAVHVTVSIGVAEYKPGEEKDAFMKRADMNMYVTKNNK